jgi:hypothetical protein
VRWDGFRSSAESHSSSKNYTASYLLQIEAKCNVQLHTGSCCWDVNAWQKFEMPLVMNRSFIASGSLTMLRMALCLDMEGAKRVRT